MSTPPPTERPMMRGIQSLGTTPQPKKLSWKKVDAGHLQAEARDVFTPNCLAMESQCTIFMKDGTPPGDGGNSGRKGGEFCTP